MKRNVNKPFERKITLYVLLGTFFFSLITGFVIYEMVYQSQLNQSRQHQKDLVYTNAMQASVGLFANNKTILNDVANGLLSSQLIEGVEISDND